MSRQTKKWKSKDVVSLNDIMNEQQAHEAQIREEEHFLRQEMFLNDDIPEEILLESLNLARMEEERRQLQQEQRQESSQDPSESTESQDSQESQPNTQANGVNGREKEHRDVISSQDHLIAMALQNQEVEAYNRKSVQRKRENGGGFSKVQSVDHRSVQNIPASAMEFDYSYNDTSLVNNFENDSTQNDANLRSFDTDADREEQVKDYVTRHNSDMWNEKHIQRLNEYDTMGNLDQNTTHISLQAYNAFRNQLEKKGFGKMNRETFSG